MSSRLSFSYPEAMRDELKVLAEADGRSLSNYIQQILSDHLESKNSKSVAPAKRRVRTKKNPRKGV